MRKSLATLAILIATCIPTLTFATGNNTPGTIYWSFEAGPHDLHLFWNPLNLSVQLKYFAPGIVSPLPGYAYDTALPGLRPSVRIQKQIRVTNLDTGAPIKPYDAVPQGTHVRFDFPAPKPGEISAGAVNGIAGDETRFIGKWIPSAAEGAACAPEDFIGTKIANSTFGDYVDYKDYMARGVPYYFYNFLYATDKPATTDVDLYGTLAVNPPRQFITNLDARLGCAVDASGATCTTPTTGSYEPVFNYEETYGVFYEYYQTDRDVIRTRDLNSSYLNLVKVNQVTGAMPPSAMLTDAASYRTGCHGGRMFTYKKSTSPTAEYTDTTKQPYPLSIPALQTTFPITVTPAADETGGKPNAPIVTDVGSCTAGTAQSYKLSYEVDGTVAPFQARYGIDWDNNGTVDQWIPPSGYVEVPTSDPQTVSHIWPANGPHTFKVLIQKSTGETSTWTTHTITCTAATNQPPTALLTANPTSVTSGSASTLQWSSTNANTCIGTGFNTNGATSGSVSTGPLTADKNYTVVCRNNNGFATDHATVTVTEDANTCPAFYTGTPPNCTLISSCPIGYTGTPPACVVAASCPVGYTGTPPVCTLASSCPAFYTGTPPNCTLMSSCPIGYTGTPPNCIPVAACGPICSGNNVINSCTGALIAACVSPQVCLSATNSCGIPSPTLINWKVTPTLVRTGKTVSVSWEVQNVASCTVNGSNGDSWTGLSGSRTSSPITVQTIYTLHCPALGGSGAGAVDKATTVNLVPVFNEK